MSRFGDTIVSKIDYFLSDVVTRTYIEQRTEKSKYYTSVWYIDKKKTEG